MKDSSESHPWRRLTKALFYLVCLIAMGPGAALEKPEMRPSDGFTNVIQTLPLTQVAREQATDATGMYPTSRVISAISPVVVSQESEPCLRGHLVARDLRHGLVYRRRVRCSATKK